MRPKHLDNDAADGIIAFGLFVLFLLLILGICGGIVLVFGVVL